MRGRSAPFGQKPPLGRFYNEYHQRPLLWYSLMGTSYRFLSDPAQSEVVLAWFRQLKEPPCEVVGERQIVLYFAHLGPLNYEEDGKTVDALASPIVTVVPPRTTHASLWTVGEVHFLTSGLRRRYPELHRVCLAFGDWLNSLECVYSLEDREGKYSYYLEGSVRNEDSPVFAFQSGLDALQNERYFVGSRDNDARLDTICRKLRLRGVPCGSSSAE